MRLYKIISFTGALTYMLLGLVTVGSVLNGNTGLYINLLMGLIFIGTGYYLYEKAKHIIILLLEVKNSDIRRSLSPKTLTKFLFLEKIFVLVSLLFGVVILSAAISRVFFERMPIFG